MTEQSSAAVTVGMPVRNGAASLERALEVVLSQTHSDLRVVISDNASTDRTPEICAAAAREDSRVRVVRQEQLLTVIQNFEFVYREANTPYFMWASHDDLRTDNYVEALVGALERAPQASFAMSGISLFTSVDELDAAEPLDYVCDTAGLSLTQLVRRRRRCMCFEIYGLFRTPDLATCRFTDYPFAPDFPIVCHALVAGDLVQTDAARFYYCIGTSQKSAEYRAEENAYGDLPTWRSSRLAALCVSAVLNSYRYSHHPRRGTLAVGVTTGTLLGLAKGGVFDAAPHWAKELWWRRAAGTRRDQPALQ